jgi:hypothetical protein
MGSVKAIISWSNDAEELKESKADQHAPGLSIHQKVTNLIDIASSNSVSSSISESDYDDEVEDYQ